MPTSRESGSGGGVVGSSRYSRRQQQHQHHHRSAPSTKMMIASPDKTEASTPPSSPDADNNNTNNNSKNHPADWGVGPDDEEENDVLQQQHRRNSLQEKQPSQPQGGNSNSNSLQGKFLSVDKILCRAPSHDSNISDLSASLSPHPAFASGGMGGNNGNNRWGEMLRRGKSMESAESEIHHNATRGAGNNNKTSDNIVLKVLNDCGVLDNVNDLLRLTNNHSYADEEDDDEDIPPPPPPPPAQHASSPPPPPPPPQQQRQQNKKKNGGFCYEMPAVWGVAPDDDDMDDDEDDNMEKTKNVKGGRGSAAEEQEEYDIVELVLDEDHLTGTSSSVPSSSNKKVSTKTTTDATTSATTVGVSPSPAKSVGGTSAAGASSGVGGGKSPVVIKGILKNKLSSMKLVSNKASTTTTSKDDDLSPPLRAVAMMGTIGGMAVVDPSENNISSSSNSSGRKEVGRVVSPVASLTSIASSPDATSQLDASAVPSPTPSTLEKQKSPVQQKQHSRSILTSSQQKKLANAIKNSSSSTASGGSVVVGSDPPGIVAENGLNAAVESPPSSSTPLSALDKVDRAMVAALTTSGGNALRNSSTNSHYGDVEINDELLLVKDDNDDGAEVNDKKTKEKRGNKKSLLGGFGFHKASKSSSTPPPKKKDPPTTTSSASMTTEDDKSYNADAATTAASNTRSNKSSTSSFRNPKSKKKTGLEADADLTFPTYDKNATSPAPQSHIEEAKKWKAILDTASNKHYYYHKVTREVRWEKPMGYDEARASKEENPPRSSASKRSVGFMGRGKKAVGAIAKENEIVSSSGANNSSSSVRTSKDNAKSRSQKENERGNTNNLSEEVEYWRATLDSTTNKTYYYNKRTKEVTWKKPACLDVNNNEGEDDGVGGKKRGKKVAETTAMASVADKRKKSWFKRGGRSNNDNNDGIDDIKENKDGAKAGDLSKKEELLSQNVDADVATKDISKYWRAALDASTGKTYYFNKKTQRVSWIKPDGFVEKDSSNDMTKRDASSKAAPAAMDVSDVENVEVADAAEDLNQTAGSSDADENQNGVSQPSTDNLSEMEGFTDAEAIDDRVKQPIKLAKEDTPFDEPFDCVPSSPKRAHFESHMQSNPIKEEEDEEQDDSFNEFENVVSDVNLNRRVKSLKSTISIDRQRTFASQTTETTRKAANTYTHQSSFGTNRGLSTFDESMNNSSIASEIFFDDAEPVESQNNHRQSSGSGDKEVLPNKNLTAPLSSRIAQSLRNISHHNDGNNRRYHGKRAENLGDSSIESIEEVDEEEDSRFYSGADDDVSALSGIGNESRGIEKNKRGPREKESSARHLANQKHPHSENVKEWTQEELDLFISKNDWGSVAEYINEMRVNKDNGGSSRRSNRNTRNQPSVREIQERIVYKKSLDRGMPGPKTRFGASSQRQHDEYSQDSRSAGESESVWQSLSSASYESESSQSRQQTPARSKRSSRELRM